MNVQLELRHIRAFVAVAEELHFTRAAQRLHITQQALSEQIRQLESSLDTQLFERTPRMVELTAAGQVLLAHAVPILDKVAAAQEQTARVGAGDERRIALCYAPTAERDTMPLLVGEVHARRPGLKVHASLMWQAESVEAVKADRFDIALSRCPAGLGADFACVPIRKQALGVLLGSDHPVADRDSVPLEELAHEPLIIWPREFSPGYHDWMIEALRARRFTGPVHEFENLGPGMLMSDVAARGEVVAGFAFSIGYADQYDPLPPGLVWRPIDPTLLVPMHMFWKHDARPGVRDFAAMALEVARTNGWLTHSEPVAGPA